MIVYCSFCGKVTPEVKCDGLNKHGLDVYYCNECSTEYLYWSDGKFAGIYLYVNIGERSYRWSTNSDKTKGYLRRCQPSPHAETPYPVKLLASFDAPLPEITPDNIEQKVKTMLVFL